MEKKRPLWLHVPCALVLACGLGILGGCGEIRIRQQCLNLRTPTVEQQQGAYAEMVAHPELKNVRIQAADLDYALRENAACWGKTSREKLSYPSKWVGKNWARNYGDSWEETGRKGKTKNGLPITNIFQTGG